MRRPALAAVFLPVSAFPLGARAWGCLAVLCGLPEGLLSTPRASVGEHVLLGLFAGGLAGALVGFVRAGYRWLTTRAREDEVLVAPAPRSRQPEAGVRPRFPLLAQLSRAGGRERRP